MTKRAAPEDFEEEPGPLYARLVHEADQRAIAGVARVFEDIAFDGVTFEPEHDAKRLGRQMLDVLNLMDFCGRAEVWKTLREISEATGHPEASVSARLRDLRKVQHGSHVIERRRRGEARRGVFEYRMA